MNHDLRRGGALLMVLWLSAALAAIAFSVALRVRGELERAGAEREGLQAYYLACGALDRALNYMRYGPGPLDASGRPRWWDRRQPRMALRFPEGDAVVEVIPESSRLNVNFATREEFERLLAALGVEAERARLIAAAILHWRGSELGDFDAYYLSSSPSFRAPRASLEQIEDLMSVAGVTPELFYGGYARAADGAVVRRPGLRDCLSVFSSGRQMDINTVQPAVMIAVGVPAPAADMIARMRAQQPIADFRQVAPLLGPAAVRFRFGGDNIYTLRATARVRRRGSAPGEARRTVAMTVQLQSSVSPEGFRILAWDESALPSPEVEAWLP
ncbi:MAG: general secretion pathway protein GspK [Bryobacteraceae bacterium]|nr:general secretion pathway protein GspK [Bryobacteraceae bacterium]